MKKIVVLYLTITMLMLCGCGKTYTAEISISDLSESNEFIAESNNDSIHEDEAGESLDVTEEKNIENINLPVTEESELVEETVSNDTPSWNYAEKENEIKNRLSFFNITNTDLKYTLYKEKHLLIVNAGFDGYAACVFDANWDQFDMVYLGTDSTQIYVLPDEEILVTICSGGVGYEYYAVYGYGFVEEMDFYYIEKTIEVEVDSSNGNDIYNMISIGGDYVKGEYWEDAKEWLISDSHNFLTENNGFLWANESDSRYDKAASDAYYKGTSFAEAFAQ